MEMADDATHAHITTPILVYAHIQLRAELLRASRQGLHMANEHPRREQQSAGRVHEGALALWHERKPEHRMRQSLLESGHARAPHYGSSILFVKRKEGPTRAGPSGPTSPAPAPSENG